MKILLLGGYGVFGGRLVELLADLADLHIVVAGRDLEKAILFCGKTKTAGTLAPLNCERAKIAEVLDDVKPDLVVDASGPFQDYGEDPYVAAKACIEKRCNYMDFADGSDFVTGIAQFDKRARDAGVFVLSGVSSFPVLTAAVLREMGKAMDVLAVTGGIAPSPYAGIGLNVMRAVVGYAGSPVKLMRDGVEATGAGLAETKRYTIAVPGHLPLKNKLFALVDVPDLQLIPKEHVTMKDIWMGAGPVPEILLRLLTLLARVRVMLRLPSLAGFSPMFYRILNLMKFGAHRGGMFIEASGMQAGKEIRHSWHLLAEGDDGPYIPSMAIEALIRKILQGQAPVIGSRSAIAALELSDYERLFSTRTIYTGMRIEEKHVPLYRNILGTAFDTLPGPLQKLHGVREKRSWSGTAGVERGQGVIAKIICRLIGFPKAGKNVAVRVSFQPDGNAERWVRDFGGRKFRSVQFPGRGRNQHLLMERFGPATFALGLVVSQGKLYLVPRSWRFLGIPMPRFMMPTGQTFESASKDAFRFDVDIALPLIGRLVHYSGTLQADA